MSGFTCPPDHKHGATSTCYCNHECRCDDCRESRTDYGRSLRRRRAYGRYVDSMILSVGTTRRVQALVACGWSLAAIAPHVGTTRMNLRRSFDSRLTTVDYAARVAEVYDVLWREAPPEGTPHERSVATAARRWATRKGWARPLAWDDDTIDDPAAAPAELRARVGVPPSLHRLDESVVDAAVRGEKPKLSPLERRAAIERLNALSWSAARIAAWIRCNPRTVVRVRGELDLPVPDQMTIKDAA